MERSDTRPNVGAINAVPNPAADSAELRVRRRFLDNLLGSLGLGCRTIGNLRRIRETVALGNLDAEHFQLGMNPGCTPQRVAATIHSMKVESRPPSPEPAEPFAVPADDRVGMDVNQGAHQPVHSRDSPTQNSRSKQVNVGRFRFRWKATS